MQQSKQIGKVLVNLETIPQEAISQAVSPSVSCENKHALELDGNATYLVTGGTSGLGLTTANWLVEKGARHLAIVSRNGFSV